jgi:outer membrane protein
MKTFVRIMTVSLLGFISQAQAFSFFDLEEGVNIVGLGVGSVPDYVGSDDSQIGVGPFGRYYFAGDRYVELLGPDLSVNILDNERFHFGPLVRYRFGRDSDVDDAVVKTMEEIDDTVELGAFVKLSNRLSDDPRHRLNLIGDVTFDVGGEHDGYFASARITYFRPIARATVIHLGAGLSYASDDYMDTYYSVDTTDNALSGLPLYEASSGMHDYRVSFGLMQHLTPNWHLGIGARYQRLVGDAQDSPVVDLRGDKNQWIYGVGLGYAWQ